MSDHFQDQLDKVKSSMSDPTKPIEENDMATKAKKTPAPKAKAPKAEKAPKNENSVSLKSVAAEFKMDPRAARKKLRAKGMKAEGRWAWDKGSKDLDKVRDLLGQKDE